jgi:hypothetical protein
LTTTLFIPISSSAHPVTAMLPETTEPFTGVSNVPNGNWLAPGTVTLRLTEIVWGEFKAAGSTTEIRPV